MHRMWRLSLELPGAGHLSAKACHQRGINLSGLHISGVLVHARPEHVSQLQERLKAVPGVEIPATTPQGRLITVIEGRSDAELADAFHHIQNTSGVLSASLVFHYSDKSSALDQEVTP